MTTADERPVIVALTGIRAVAAGWVVLEHFNEPLFTLLPSLQPLRPLILGGFLGVEVFFVLSGFIISHNYALRFRTGLNRKRYLRFLQLRFARIYPVHLATLLLMASFVAGAGALGLGLNSQSVYTPGSFVMNIVMLQAIPPALAWNGPAWSISCEVAAYAAFPLIATFALHLRRRTAAVVSAILLGVLILAAFLFASVERFTPTMYPMLWLRIGVEFTVGSLIWAIWHGRVVPSGRWDVVALVSAGGTLAVLRLVGDMESPANFLAVPLIALLIASCASAAGPVAQLLSSRAMIWGGKISYSVYMTHFFVLIVVGKVFDWQSFAHLPLIARVMLLGALLCATVAAGAATYYLVEEPGRRFVRRVTMRASAVPIAAVRYGPGQNAEGMDLSNPKGRRYVNSSEAQLLD